MAIALSNTLDIHVLVRTMIRDQTTVNETALAPLDELGASVQDTPDSQSINANAKEIIIGFVQLRGRGFDKAKYTHWNSLSMHAGLLRS